MTSIPRRRLASLFQAVALTLLLTLTFAASAQAATSRVIGGDAVDDPAYTAKWGSTVALISNGEEDPWKGQFCAGTLIEASGALDPTESWVITAAHCVSSYGMFEDEISIDKPSSVDVFGGSRKLSGSGQRINVAEIIVHPDYDPSWNVNDVALLRLEEAPDPALPTMELIGTTLADQTAWGDGSGAAATGGNGPWVGGWGTRDALSELYQDRYAPPPDTLFQVEVPIIHDDICENGDATNVTKASGLGRYFRSESMLCAGVLDTHDANDANAENNAKDACFGDSGGPLIVQVGADYKLAGIVSWGFECGLSNQYGVYTRVDGIRGWVETNPPPPVRNTVKPKVTGAPLIGGEVTCQTGTWTPAVGDPGAPTYTYQWVREIAWDDEDFEEYYFEDEEDYFFFEESEFEEIEGETGQTYEVKAADKGLELACRVTATNASSKLTVESPSTRAVSADRFAPRVTIVDVKCYTTQCTTTVKAVDPDGAAIESVTGRVGKNGGDTKTYAGEFKTGSLWEIKVPKKSGFYEGSATAKDQFGKKSKPAFWTYMVKKPRR